MFSILYFCSILFSVILTFDTFTSKISDTLHAVQGISDYYGYALRHNTVICTAVQFIFDFFLTLRLSEYVYYP